MPFPSYKIFEQYEPDKYKTSEQKKVEKVLQEAGQEQLAKRQEGIASPEFQELLAREGHALEKFFGEQIEVPDLPAEITPERYQEWKEKGYELHYLPPEELTKDRGLPGWKKKPNDWFYDEIKEGNLSPDSAKLPGDWVLIDEREKPQYQGGQQTYDNDVLAPALEQLRKKGLIEKYDSVPANSRFGIGWNELNQPEVKKALSEVLGVEPENLRLPKAIEWNYLGNAFYKKWGDSNTWEWFEDSYQNGQGRLFGGHSGGGGLSSVGWDGAGDRGGGLGFRPLVVFPQH